MNIVNTPEVVNKYRCDSICSYFKDEVYAVSNTNASMQEVRSWRAFAIDANERWGDDLVAETALEMADEIEEQFNIWNRFVMRARNIRR